MPEITKSGAKLHLFIVTHKYTDLYFIFSFNNQPQVGKPTWGYNYTTALRRLPHPSSAIIIGLRQRRDAKNRRRAVSYVSTGLACLPRDTNARTSSAIHRIAPLVAMHHRHRRKTAEERFNMLARGWLAYPVTPMHARLPPKSGCINVIPRFAISRRRATALFRNPVCKAQRSVPGFSSTPTSACRRYATSPPSAVAYIIGLPHPARCITKKPPKSGCRKHPRRRHCEAQNAAERVPQRGSISAAHSGISEQYRFANIPSVVR